MDYDDDMRYMKSTHCGYCEQQKPVEKSWALPSIAKLMNGKGYCNNSSITFYPDELTLEKYESLMKDGWRRSGGFMYKPDLLRSCCRAYTIRTNYDMFVNDGYYNKSTKKNIRRFYKNVDAPESANGISLYESYLEKDKKGRFYSILLPNTYSPDRFELYKKYQMSIHHDEESTVTEESFFRFLCDDPFMEEDKDLDWNQINREWLSGQPGEALKNLKGPIHECYVMDDKLIAIAVMDVLPTTVSSVYFIWDPDYAHLGLGTVSAIREILFTKLLQKDHYYLGFYIADCDKMVYKAKFGGEIRNLHKDNENLKWVKLKEVDNVLKNGGFSVFEKRDNKLVDVAEEIFGVSGCTDNELLDSFAVMKHTCIFPTPAVIP